jgi:hypothetical protein
MKRLFWYLGLSQLMLLLAANSFGETERDLPLVRGSLPFLATPGIAVMW